MATRKKGVTKAASSRGFVDVNDVAYLFVRLLLLLGFDDSVIRKAIQRVGKPARSRSIKVIGGSLDYWARLVTRWVTDTRFVGEEGRPRDLPMKGVGGFADLVETVHPGENPVLCLEILQGVGAAVRLSNGKIRCRNRSAITNADLKAPIFIDEYLQPLLSLLMILESGPNKKATGLAAEAFQRSVTGIELPAEEVPQLRGFVERQGMVFIEAMDEWLNQRAKKPMKSGRSAKLVRPYIGLYMTADDLSPSTPLGRRRPVRQRRTRVA